MGLLNEAKDSYKQAIQMIQDEPKVKDAQKVIEGIRQKLGLVDKDIAKIADAPPPEVSPKIQELIKRQFAFASDDNARALEGAIALAKFGQFEKALSEFNALMDRQPLRVDAAKNIVRCCIALKDIDKAIAQYNGWQGSDLFTDSELTRIKLFVEAMFKKEGIDRDLPAAPPKPQVLPAAAPEPPVAQPPGPPAAMEEEILEINSIGITIEENRRPKTVEINVSFQSGSTISILLPSRDKLLIERLKVGTVVEDVQFYSEIAIFNGNIEVTGNTRIESGPRRGDFSVDMKVMPA
jgi:tetratricopeptide (TPR) repeat protein